MNAKIITYADEKYTLFQVSNGYIINYILSDYDDKILVESFNKLSFIKKLKENTKYKKFAKMIS